MIVQSVVVSQHRQPEIAAAADLVMVISELRLTVQGMTPPVFSLAAFEGATNTSFITINGLVNPTIRLRPGEIQRIIGTPGIDHALPCNPAVPALVLVIPERLKQFRSGLRGSAPDRRAIRGIQAGKIRTETKDVNAAVLHA